MRAAWRVRPASILPALMAAGRQRRIKAADVERAIAARAAPRPSALPDLVPTPRVRPRQPQALPSTSLRFSIGKRINVDRLPDLIADLADTPGLMAGCQVPGRLFWPPTSASPSERRRAAVIGLAADDFRYVSAPLVAACQPSRRRTAPHGTLPRPMMLLDGISALPVRRMPPAGWAASLGVGAMRAAFRPDADGRAVARRTCHFRSARSTTPLLDPRRQAPARAHSCILLENPLRSSRKLSPESHHGLLLTDEQKHDRRNRAQGRRPFRPRLLARARRREKLSRSEFWRRSARPACAASRCPSNMAAPASACWRWR